MVTTRRQGKKREGQGSKPAESPWRNATEPDASQWGVQTEGGSKRGGLKKRGSKKIRRNLFSVHNPKLLASLNSRVSFIWRHKVNIALRKALEAIPVFRL